MALEDIANDVEEETKEEEVEELSNELGIEDKEDLEHLSDRITRLFNTVESIDRKLEELEGLEKEIRVNRGAIAAILSFMDNPEDDIAELASEKDVSISDEEDKEETVDFKVGEEEEEETNPWMTGDNQ